jgi:beta-mannanase
VVAATLLAVVGPVVLAACGSSSSPHSAQPPAPACHKPLPTGSALPADEAPAPPRSGSYFGGFSLLGSDVTQSALTSSFDTLQRTACATLAIAHVYLPYGHPFPTASATTFAQSGHIVMVSWAGTDIPQMASGQDDAEIVATAHQIASLHSPVFLEFRWEMDRPNLASDVVSPTAYITAWDRIRSLFRSAGVHNASWVWCPTAVGFASGRAQSYYPGNDEVDWVCADAYPDYSQPDSSSQQLGALIAPFVNWARGTGKPAMIGEFGVPNSYSPQQRAAWLRNARAALTEPPIKAAVYFEKGDSDKASLSYLIGNDADVVTAFRSLVAGVHQPRHGETVGTGSG